MQNTQYENNPEIELNSSDISGLDKDVLNVLTVIDRLEIGNVKLEKRRLSMPYKVFQNGNVDTLNLEYSFEEEVFDPSKPASINLACMIGAQVALNYGLFCREIIFNGVYDQRDRQFIKEMAENTAREIFVKKFLQHNSFIKGLATQLPSVKFNSYLCAKIIFTNELPEKLYKNSVKSNGNWIEDEKAYALLSSGGKDSLLSFGLLQELGYKTHPVFINESGRHWFSALNAYRYFKDNYPETARVWTNSDRIFAWMLRHIPFIRKDFANVRSDDYPIRLWTMAVFLFGALPILRKRGINRLIIGDEYDTTSRSSYKGITHYNGLYDQSVYFDNALTQYFIRKGWCIYQFSILRPLSELLVLKTLVNRYSELHQNQVSCHAAHKKGDSILPCGRCEKCRRIVTMLKAIDADPGQCGYTQDQIKSCLELFIEKGIHQEKAAIQQLKYLLFQKGLVPHSFEKSKKVYQRPEIMKLRFDSEQSPFDGIPTDLRQPLYKIYLEYSEGAVRKNGKVWIDFDPFSDASISLPYPFESKKTRLTKTSSIQQNKSLPKNNFLLKELTWPEAKKKFKEVDIALLPVGSIEQHGHHLPLDTDAFDADYLACKVAEACSNPKPIVLPLISYGVSYHHEDFSGTISVSNETLSRLVYEVGMGAARNGITKLIIINGHGGNTPSLKFAAQMINRDGHIFSCVDTGETSDADIYSMAETPNDVHAGEIETSMTMYIRPDLVQLEKARKFVPDFSSRYLNFTSKKSVEWYTRTLKISDSGVLGDPKKASYEKGQRFWAVMIKNLVEFVEDIKGMSLNEIYEKKY